MIRSFALSLLIAACVLPGCALRRNPSEPGDVAPKLARSTFVEEGSLVGLVVSTRPMRFRLDRAYIPLEIAVVNKGLQGLTLTPESFTLMDAAGNRYPAVGRDELQRLYGSTDVDRNYAEALPFIRQKYASFRRQPSNFTPGFDAGIGIDRVSLPRFSYLYDFLYFQRPSGDLVQQPLELLVAAPELTDTLFVRFALGDGSTE